jgi:hypothetical protein
MKMQNYMIALKIKQLKFNIVKFPIECVPDFKIVLFYKNIDIIFYVWSFKEMVGCRTENIFEV